MPELLGTRCVRASAWQLRPSQGSVLEFRGSSSSTNKVHVSERLVLLGATRAAHDPFVAPAPVQLHKVMLKVISFVTYETKDSDGSDD